MREIKFRGKSVRVENLDSLEIKHENGWVSGNLIVDGKQTWIVGGLAEITSEYIQHEFWAKVEPKTIGQFTGLLDKNGKEIYEGDVLKVSDSSASVFYSEQYLAYYIKWVDIDTGTALSIWKHNQIEVIGNIYENPELLKEELK